MSNSLGVGFSKNFTAGNVARSGRFARAVAVSLKSICFRFCYCKRFAARAAIADPMCGAQFRRSIALSSTANRPRAVRSPIAALHRARTCDYTGRSVTRRSAIGLLGAGGRLQQRQYWVSNTGCPGPSGGPSVRRLGRACCCDFILLRFSRRLPYPWFSSSPSFEWNGSR
jgi:hypothetical protein